MSDERAAEGVEHLQAAALEMISATRAFLDVLEEVVTDKAKVSAVMGAVGSVAQVAVRTATRATNQPTGGRDGHFETESDDGRVQHIRVT